MQLAMILAMQKNSDQQAKPEKATEQKEDKAQAAEKGKTEVAQTTDASVSKEAPQLSDIQKVYSYFTNISLVGSYAHEAGKSEPSEGSGGK